MPSGEIAMALLALCPDEETRQNFFLAISEGTSIIPSTRKVELTKEEEEARPGAMNKRGRVPLKQRGVRPKQD